MFIKTTKSKGYEYLYLVESVVENGRKKFVTLERLGRTDLMSPELIQSLRERYVDGRKYNVAQIEQHVKEVRPLILGKLKTESRSNGSLDSTSMDVDSEVVDDTVPDLHYGHLIAKQVWNNILCLPRLIHDLQRHQLPNLSYSLNDAGYFLTASKMLAPSSYLDLFNHADTFLANPIASVRLELLYKALAHLGQFKDQIMRCAYRNVSAHFGFSKPKLLYFDCTNFYFETPYDSKEEFIMDFYAKRSHKLQSEGATSAEVKQHLQSEEFEAEVTKAIEQAEESGQLMRRRGPSKEGRFAQPLIGMALVIDEHGFPLDFELYPGNKSEFGYLRSAVSSIKEKYGISDAFYVADRGLNSSQNLQFIQSNDLGFVVAQKVSHLPPKQYNEMMSQQGWKSIDFSEDQWAVQLFEDVDGGSYRYKVCDHVKVYTEQVKDAAGMIHRQKHTVNCKIIYTYSDKRYRRDMCVIEAMEAKARAAVAAGNYAGNINNGGWRCLLRIRADVEGNKKDKELLKYVDVDDEKINQMKAIAGYAALVFAAPKECNLSDDSLEISAQKGYKQLVSIEDCFRTAKTTLNLRPVFLKRNDRTKGHCLLCILALMMLKVIQYNLRQANINMSLGKIQTAMDQAMVAALPSAINTGKALYINNSCHYRDYDKERKLTQTAAAQSKRNTRLSTAFVVKAVGLTPLKALETERNIRLKLKVDPRVPLLTAEQLDDLQQILDQ